MNKIIKKGCFWIVEKAKGWGNWKAYIDPEAKMCSKCLQEQIREDQKVCYTCYQEINHQRLIKDDEVVFDIDDPTDNGTRCIHAIADNLRDGGYNFEIWKAEGQKQPHIHVKNIKGLSKLTPEQLKNYKKLITEKYIPQDFWNDKIPDSSLYSKHLIAEEDKPHFKYKNIKTLIVHGNPNNENKAEPEILNQCKGIVQSVQPYNSEKLAKGEYLYQKIASKLPITKLADAFGLTPQGKPSRVCPFHADSNPSLNLSDEKGIFYCYGCNLGGNIIKFYAMLKQLRPEFKLEVLK